jgi:glycosyltransferase involved in cell wall biosynthesis
MSEREKIPDFNIEGRGIDNFRIKSFIEAAFQSKNILLLEYVSEYCQQLGLSVPEIAESTYILQSEIKEQSLLRWFDTKLPESTESDDNVKLTGNKIEKIFNQIKETANGGLVACIIVPALNEEKHLPKLLESIRNQQTSYPVIVLISDNGSTDQTKNIAVQNGANIFTEKTRGIGPARQGGLDHVKNNICSNHDKVIVMQLDADEAIINRSYVQEVCKSYEKNTRLMASVGPIEFPLTLANQQNLILSGGKQFRDMFDTFSLKEMFEQNGRNIEDYLLGPPYRYFAGGNSVYRLSLFDQTGIRYPKDKSWESVLMSVQIQQHLKPDQIALFPFQTIQTSSRAFTDEKGVVSENKIEIIRKNGYIPPYKSEDSLSPITTLQGLIRMIDKKTYSLSESDSVVGIFRGTPECTVHSASYRILPLRHAVSGETVEGKYVVIRRKK